MIMKDGMAILKGKNKKRVINKNFLNKDNLTNNIKISIFLRKIMDRIKTIAQLLRKNNQI